MKIKLSNPPDLVKSPLIAIFLVVFIMVIYGNASLYSSLGLPLLSNAKLKFQDGYFKARLLYNEHIRKDYPKESAVVLIAVDRESILKIKQDASFYEEVVAKTIENISGCKPKLIVLDIMFPRGENTPLLIADAIKKAGNVLVAVGSKDLGVNYVDEAILKASLSYGSCNFVVPSNDNVARTFKYIILQSKDKFTIPISIIAALAYQDIPLNRVKMIIPPSNKVILTFDNKEIITLPVNENGDSLINYLYNKEDIPTLPMWRLIEGDFDPDLLKGKIVFLYVISDLYEDIHLTPIGGMRGVMVIANITNSLIHSDFLVEPSPLLQIVDMAILYLVSALLAFLFYRTRILLNILILISPICLFLAISFALFLHNILWSAFDLIVLPFLLHIAISYHKLLIFEIDRRSIT